MSPHFQVILGFPFLVKFQFNIDFKSNNLRNINIIIPILRGSEHSITTVYAQYPTFPAFANKKYLILPLSEKNC